jgi:hypothetical protein
VLKAFALAKGLLDKLSFIFIVDLLLLVMVLTMFQVVFGLLEFNRSFL